MLYPILVEYYLYFGFLLLLTTFIARKDEGESRTNLLYLYGMIIALGFLLSLDWMAGVVFGCLVLEVGRTGKRWLDKKRDALK